MSESNDTIKDETAFLQFLDDVTFLGHIDTVQELSDILVSNQADLVDVCTGLGNFLDGNTRNNKLILLSLGDLSLDILWNVNSSELLVTQEVSDLDNLMAVLLDNRDIDREMCIDKSHLVKETNGNTCNHVGDERLDGSQSGDMSSVSIMDVCLDEVLADRHESHVNVLQVLSQGTLWTGNLNES